MSLRFYVSGPIAGYPERNKLSFDIAAIRLRRLGHVPVLPLTIDAWQHGGPCPRGYTNGEGHSSACWLRADLVVMLQCDAVLMLPAWEWSQGATLEHRVAIMTGMPVYYDSVDVDIPAPLLPKDHGYRSIQDRSLTQAQNNPASLFAAALEKSP